MQQLLGINRLSRPGSSLTDRKRHLPRSCLVTQLDIPTHRLQPELRLVRAGRTARASQPAPRTVLGNTFGFPAHAIPDISAEGTDFVVEWPFRRGANGQVSTDGLRVKVRPRRQLPFESQVAGGGPYPNIVR